MEKQGDSLPVVVVAGGAVGGALCIAVVLSCVLRLVPTVELIQNTILILTTFT